MLKHIMDWCGVNSTDLPSDLSKAGDRQLVLTVIRKALHAQHGVFRGDELYDTLMAGEAVEEDEELEIRRERRLRLFRKGRRNAQ